MATGRDVLLLGSSAGGVVALRDLVAALPPDLPATILVVLHLPRAGGSSTLPDILARVSRLPVRAARDGEELVPGTVLVAPVGRHLLVRDGRVALSTGPPENGQRPAVDALFRSAAREYGSRVVAVVLTGSLDDGSAGLRAVQRHGGATVVQDPADAMFAGMPSNALVAVPEAIVATLVELPGLCETLVRGPRGPELELSQDLLAQEEQEVDTALGLRLPGGRESHAGEPSAYSCPDCNGVLFQLDDGPLLRYRCRVGHAWSAEALSQRQAQAVEGALWTALRALEERASMAHDVVSAAVKSGRGWSEQQFRRTEQEATRHAEVLRRLLLTAPEPPAAALDDAVAGDAADLVELPQPPHLAPVPPDRTGT